MSKAFTSEETPEPGPVVRAPPAPGGVRLVTPEGHAALRAALSRLREERAAAGALPESERAARTADLDARAALLEATLAAVTVRRPDEAPEGEAGFGSWVTIQEADGTRRTWRLVGPDEVDARRGLASVHAPLGRALLGRRAGDEVEIHRPGGTVGATVLEVRHDAP